MSLDLLHRRPRPVLYLIRRDRCAPVVSRAVVTSACTSSAPLQPSLVHVLYARRGAHGARQGGGRRRARGPSADGGPGAARRVRSAAGSRHGLRPGGSAGSGSPAHRRLGRQQRRLTALSQRRGAGEWQSRRRAVQRRGKSSIAVWRRSSSGVSRRRPAQSAHAGAQEAPVGDGERGRQLRGAAEGGPRPQQAQSLPGAPTVRLRHPAHVPTHN